MNRAFARQVAWFAGIGVINTGVDFAVLNMLLLVFGVSSGWWYVVMKAVSFLAANVNSYFLNTRFTFPTARSPKSFGSFFVATLVGLGVNVAVAVLARMVLGTWLSPLGAANVAALGGTAASLVVNFVLYKYVVFGKGERTGA